MSGQSASTSQEGLQGRVLDQRSVGVALERNAGAGQRFAHHISLGVGSIKDGEVSKTIVCAARVTFDTAAVEREKAGAADEPLNAVNDKLRLGFVGNGLVDCNRR